jgi:phi13 family phage major tail protein
MPTSPAAAPAVSSTVGLKNLVIAPLLTDTETETTYGDLQKVAGAIEASITPDNADPEVQYYDDVEGDVLYPDPELAFKTKLADLPLLIQEMIFSNEMDDNGVLIRKASDKPGYFAVGFKSEKANGKYRYIWLYKTRAKPVTENYATREGKTITRQTGEVEWVAVKRISDGRYQAVADEGENGFTAEKAATFLDSVYTPVVAVPGG